MFSSLVIWVLLQKLMRMQIRDLLVCLHAGFVDFVLEYYSTDEGK